MMYDRRNGGAWVTLIPFLFNARFDDGLTIEIQVNPEFETLEIAESYAKKFAPVIGRLTTELRRDVETVCCLLYTSPSPRDVEESRMPSSA